MLATNFNVVRRLCARITQDRLDRFMMRLEDAGTVLAIVAGVAAAYFLIRGPIHRMIMQ